MPNLSYTCNYSYIRVAARYNPLTGILRTLGTQYCIINYAQFVLIVSMILSPYHDHNYVYMYMGACSVGGCRCPHCQLIAHGLYSSHMCCGGYVYIYDSLMRSLLDKHYYFYLHDHRCTSCY